MRRFLMAILSMFAIMSTTVALSPPSTAYPYCQPGQCDDWWRDPPPPPPPVYVPIVPVVAKPLTVTSTGQWVASKTGASRVSPIRWFGVWEFSDEWICLDVKEEEWQYKRLRIYSDNSTDYETQATTTWSVSGQVGWPYLCRGDSTLPKGQTSIQKTSSPIGPTKTHGDRLLPGDVIGGTAGVASKNKKFVLIVSGEGDLILISVDQQKALWRSGTAGNAGAYAVFQGDGNFVLYNKNRQPIWHSATYQQGADRAVMQDDGNFVVYAASSALWHTHTWGGVFHV